MIKMSIDPGISGAMCLNIDGKIVCHNCPDTQAEMADLVLEYKNLSIMNDCPIVGTIELVHSMTKQGVKSTWTFSANYASWQMALICNKIPFTEIRPKEWQKRLGGCPKDKKERKNYIKDKMQKAYPQLKVTLKNADALAMLWLMR